MIGFGELVTRHSRVFLLGTGVSSAVVGVAIQVFHTAAGVALTVTVLLASLVLLVTGMLTGERRDGPPAVLVQAEGPSFATPVAPLNVLSAAALIVLWVGFLLPEKIGDVVRGQASWLAEIPLVLFMLILVLFAIRRAVITVRARLLPTGVECPGGPGPALVPWDEIDPAEVTVVSRLGVRGVALTRRSRFLASPGPGRLAAIIRSYAADPTHRSAIGSPPELARLTRTEPSAS